MKAHVKLFAILREKAGTSDLTLELPEAATVADLLEEVTSRYPELLDSASHTMVAVNTEYVQETQPLRDGDEVALIPPVSGGAPICAASTIMQRDPVPFTVRSTKLPPEDLEQ